MAEYFVRIKKETLRRNPESGPQRRLIPGQMIQHPDGSQERQMIETNYTAQSWLYDHEDVEVECKWCHAKFSYRELQSDEDFDGTLVDSICPKCGAEWCCEVFYETVEEALRRTA